jgi:hypothetical protein|tara:strand:- start:1764 stop:2009 length:246 start_codon:yes stop_codon:yes gene_type:complete
MTKSDRVNVNIPFNLEGSDKLLLEYNLNEAKFEVGNPCYVIKIGNRKIGKVYVKDEMKYVLHEGFESYKGIVRRTIFDRLF